MDCQNNDEKTSRGDAVVRLRLSLGGGSVESLAAAVDAMRAGVGRHHVGAEKVRKLRQVRFAVLWHAVGCVARDAGAPAVECEVLRGEVDCVFRLLDEKALDEVGEQGAHVRVAPHVRLVLGCQLLL